MPLPARLVDALRVARRTRGLVRRERVDDRTERVAIERPLENHETIALQALEICIHHAVIVSARGGGAEQRDRDDGRGLGAQHAWPETD